MRIADVTVPYIPKTKLIVVARAYRLHEGLDDDAYRRARREHAKNHGNIINKKNNSVRSFQDIGRLHGLFV